MMMMTRSSCYSHPISMCVYLQATDLISGGTRQYPLLFAMWAGIFCCEERTWYIDCTWRLNALIIKEELIEVLRKER